MDTTKDEFHSYNQAAAQMSGIAAMVAALECDYERLEELREKRQNLATYTEGTKGEIDATLEAWDEANGEELRELEEAALAGESQACYALKSQDEARERITEDPLEITLTGSWAPGDKPEAEGFIILLCTGGQAVRIKGELDQHGEPYRAWLEHQDWGTPWTEYHGANADQETLLTYCRQFYFGEG